MERKINRRGKAILLQVFFVLAVTFQARATVVNWNSIEVNDVEYYVQTDKFVYNLGEDVDTLFRVTNLRDEVWTFGYMPPVLDILVAAKDGEIFNTVWFWSWDGIWPAGPKVFELQPGESVELNGIWPQIDLNGTWEIEDDTQVLPGIYGIGGRIGRSAFNDSINNTLYLEITIIPEPTSLALIGIGLFRLLIHNKKRKH